MIHRTAPRPKAGLVRIARVIKSFPFLTASTRASPFAKSSRDGRRIRAAGAVRVRRIDALCRAEFVESAIGAISRSSAASFEMSTFDQYVLALRLSAIPRRAFHVLGVSTSRFRQSASLVQVWREKVRHRKRSADRIASRGVRSHQRAFHAC